jgi:hypothetical protein
LTAATGSASPPSSTTPAARCCLSWSPLERRPRCVRSTSATCSAARYFDVPYPEPIEAIKQALYPHLLPIARDWWTRLGRTPPWPDSLDEWLEQCHTAGQTKATAILFRYGEGDWNALHRDLYGDLVFPLQVVINLNEPGVDHTGGEFLLVEQRPRAQSRGTATVVPHGHGYVFTTRERPVASARGWSAAPVRHGVSMVRSGERYALALVFHDAA